MARTKFEYRYFKVFEQKSTVQADGDSAAAVVWQLIEGEKLTKGKHSPENLLNSLGRGGWELAGIVGEGGLIFKRRYRTEKEKIELSGEERSEPQMSAD